MKHFLIFSILFTLSLACYAQESQEYKLFIGEFENKTDIENPLLTHLNDTLIYIFSHSKLVNIHAVPPGTRSEYLQAAWNAQSNADATQLALLAGKYAQANAILVGSYTKTGTRWSIEAQLYVAQAGNHTRELIQLAGEDVYYLLDNLAAEVVQRLGAGQYMPLSTRAWKAYAAYRQGHQALYDCDYQGAIRHFQKAIALQGGITEDIIEHLRSPKLIDSLARTEYSMKDIAYTKGHIAALATMGLGWVYEMIGEPKKAIEAYQNAFRLKSPNTQMLANCALVSLSHNLGETTSHHPHHYFEAEEAVTFTPYFEIAQASESSGSKYLWTPDTLDGFHDDEGEAIYEFEVEQPSTYRLVGRIVGESSYANGIRVSIGNQDTNLSVGGNAAWEWRAADATFTVLAGKHRLVVRNKDDGVKLDCMVLYWERHLDFANPREERKFIITTFETMYESFSRLAEKVEARNAPDIINSICKTLAMIQKLKDLYNIYYKGGVVTSKPGDDLVDYIMRFWDDTRFRSATFYLDWATGLQGYGFIDCSGGKLLGMATEIFASKLPRGTYLLTGGKLGGFLMDSGGQIIVPGLRYYREALAGNPRITQLKRLPSDYLGQRMASAISYYRAGRFQEAEMQYQEIITLLPRYLDAYINLGALYCRMERFPDAERVLQKALELDPRSTAARLTLSIVYALKYDSTSVMYTKSTEEFEKAAKLAPNMTRPHKLLGVNYFMLKEYQKAIGSPEGALKIDLKTARDFLIQAYEKVRLLDKAREQQLQKLLQDLKEFVQKHDNENARSKYLSARFGKFIRYVTNIFTEASENKTLSVMQEIEKVIFEAQLIASLTFEGWQPEDEQWPNLPALPSVNSWLDDLEETGLARRKNLPNLLRSGAVSDPDDFYQEPVSTKPTLGELVIPSLSSLQAKLPLEAQRRISERKFIQEHSIHALELEVSMLQAECEALAQEAAGVPSSYRSTWLNLYELKNKLLKEKRKSLKIMRGSVEIIDKLQEDFLGAAGIAQADRSLSSEARKKISSQYDRSMSAIRDMRKFASGENVDTFVEKNKVGFIILGQKQFKEFCSAMKKYGVSISRVGVTDFSKISKLPDIKHMGEITGSNSVLILGLKSLDALRRSLRYQSK